MRPLIAVLAAGMALALAAPAQAQAPNVQILALDCASNPEVVTIRNMAHIPQDVRGWTLQSDGGDSFDLGSQVVSLAPVHEGGQISVYSSSQAPATNPAQWQYRWTTSEVFRDGDGTDFVRIVDGTGGIIGQQNCLQESAPREPTPTPSQPQAQPTAAALSDTAAPQVAQTGGSNVFGPPAPRAVGQQLPGQQLAVGQQFPASGGRTPSSGGVPFLFLGIATAIAGGYLLAGWRKTRT
jgi:hypothetical protein